MNKAHEVAKEVLGAKYLSLTAAGVWLLASEVIRLSKAMEEAKAIFSDMSPATKMSESFGTLARRTEVQGNLAKAWVAKYGNIND